MDGGVRARAAGGWGGRTAGFVPDSLPLGRGAESGEGELGVEHGGGQEWDEGSIICHDDGDGKAAAVKLGGTTMRMMTMVTRQR